jgi:CheY-like chemotaxis protein
VLLRYTDEISLVPMPDLAEACEKAEGLPNGVLMINAMAAGDWLAHMRKAEALSPHTPVIVSSLPAYDVQATLAGASGYLTKPVSRNDLEAALHSVGSPVQRVLVVDDDPDVLGLLTRMLRVCDAKLEIEVASSGEEALKVLRCGTIDVMLLDVVMPGMNGWQVLEKVRDDRGCGNPAIFLVSAQDPLDAQEMVTPLAVTMGNGLSLKRFLCCAVELSTILLKPERELDPVPPRTGVER